MNVSHSKKSYLFHFVGIQKLTALQTKKQIEQIETFVLKMRAFLPQLVQTIPLEIAINFMSRYISS